MRTPPLRRATPGVGSPGDNDLKLPTVVADVVVVDAQVQQTARRNDDRCLIADAKRLAAVDASDEGANKRIRQRRAGRLLLVQGSCGSRAIVGVGRPADLACRFDSNPVSLMHADAGWRPLPCRGDGDGSGSRAFAVSCVRATARAPIGIV